jgi:hypothetical protein
LSLNNILFYLSCDSFNIRSLTKIVMIDNIGPGSSFIVAIICKRVNIAT